MTRHHDDRHGGIRGLDALEHLETVHARHLDVEKHQVGRVAFNQRQAFLARCRADELIALIFERSAHRVADARFVINDQNSGFHLPSVDADRANRALIRSGHVDIDGQHITRDRRTGQPVVGIGGVDRPAVDLHHDVIALDAGVSTRRSSGSTRVTTTPLTPIGQPQPIGRGAIDIARR